METNIEILTLYPFLKDHVGKSFYVYFKCVYLEDGENPEYECKFISDDINFLTKKMNNESHDFYACYDCIDKFVVNFEKNTNKIFWNEKYQSWTDLRAFKSISIRDFQTKLQCKK